jgi:hypothetical protein
MADDPLGKKRTKPLKTPELNFHIFPVRSPQDPILGDLGVMAVQGLSRIRAG